MVHRHHRLGQRGKQSRLVKSLLPVILAIIILLVIQFKNLSLLTRRNNNDAVPEILAGIAPYSEIENNDLGIEQNMEIEANESWGEAIRLLDQNVGHIKRLCEGSSSCLLPTPKDQTDVNTPTPIHIRPWMIKQHPSLFEGKSVIMYYSSHTTNSIGLLTRDKKTQIWERIFPHPQENNVGTSVSLSFEPMVCGSIHSPSIWVDDKQERFFM